MILVLVVLRLTVCDFYGSEIGCSVILLVLRLFLDVIGSEVYCSEMLLVLRLTVLRC